MRNGMGTALGNQAKIKAMGCGRGRTQQRRRVQDTELTLPLH
jgi:hypothetical protein